MSSKSIRLALLILPFSVVVLLDQFSKYWVRNNPTLQNLDLIEGVLEFSYTLNDGMALGINWLPTRLISVVAIIATLVIIGYVISNWKKATSLYLFCISMVMGGAVGNIIDRIIMGKILGHGGILEGHVVDFIYFSLQINNWTVFPYIFNVADVAISGSIITLIIFNKVAFKEVEEVESLNESDTNEATLQ
jgi:signal peptidase II